MSRLPLRPGKTPLFTLLVGLLFGGGLLFALHNLWLWREMPVLGLVVSALWVLIIGLIVYQSVEGTGSLRGALKRLLGELRETHFVEATPGLLRFGYTAFGRSVYLKSIPIAEVVSVSWGAGQATSLAGKDMKDWGVSLRSTKDFQYLGPHGPQAEAEALIQPFTALAAEAGVELVAGEKPRTLIPRVE